jgi:hypothetical protein
VRLDDTVAAQESQIQGLHHVLAGLAAQAPGQLQLEGITSRELQHMQPGQARITVAEAAAQAYHEAHRI